MAWIPSYRDFDQYDTTVKATSKEHALEVFNKTSMAKFMKYEPCIQTEKECKDMYDRMEAMTTVCPPPKVPCSAELNREEYVDDDTDFDADGEPIKEEQKEQMKYINRTN